VRRQIRGGVDEDAYKFCQKKAGLRVEPVVKG
jgi:hypothetical protein